MANDHIKYLKSMMEEDLSTVELLCGRQISPRPSSTRNSFSKLSGGGNGVQGAVSRVLRESVMNPATGKLINVAKVFVVTPENLPYQDVGWVHRSCVNNCMICNAPFGMMNRKHNCYSCGFVVCNACSNREAQIDQLQSPRLPPEENGSKYRVCKRCIKGAKKVSATVTPRNVGSSTATTKGRIFFPDDSPNEDTDRNSIDTKDLLPSVSPRIDTSVVSSHPVKKEIPLLEIPSDNEVHLVESERFVFPGENQAVESIPITVSHDIESSPIISSQSSPPTSVTIERLPSEESSPTPFAVPPNNPNNNSNNPTKVTPPITPSRTYLHRAPIPKQGLESPRVRREIYQNHSKHHEVVNSTPSPKHDVKGIAESFFVPNDVNSLESPVTSCSTPLATVSILTGIMVPSNDEFIVLPELPTNNPLNEKASSEEVPVFSLAQNVMCNIDSCIIS